MNRWRDILVEWFEVKIKVRYSETDQMAIAYHGNYFSWFEVARTEMIRGIGTSYKEMEEHGVLLPVIDVSCQYKVSAKYDDELVVRVKCTKYNGIRMDFAYEIIREADQALIATGATKHAWIDKKYRPVRLGKIVPAIHKKLLQELEK